MKSSFIDEEGVLHIKGDVTIADGPVIHNGAVVVDGSLLSRSRIDVTGDVTILGAVDDAVVLSTEGSIFLQRGFTGSGGTVLGAKKDVVVKHIQDATIGAGQDVVVEGSLTRCRVDAGRRVLTGNGEGRMVGGSVWAKESIELVSIGSAIETSTEVVVDSPDGWIKAVKGIQPGTVVNIAGALMHVRREKFPCRAVHRNGMVHMEELA